MSALTIPFLGPITPAGVGIWTIVAGLVVALIRIKPLMVKLKNEADVSLRVDLFERIKALEEQQVDDRKLHAEERRKDREECDARNKELEDRIRKQNETIDGLQRQLIMFQVASARALPLGQQSPEIEAMLASLVPLYAAPSGPKSETLKSAEDTAHAADMTVEQIKQDEVRQ